MKDLSGVFRKPLFAIVICGMGRKIVYLERLLTRRRRISLLLKNRMVMETSIKTTVFALAGCVMAISGTAQTPKASLSTILSRSVCERVQVPMIFSTRDTAFALSLPSDEPATIYLQLTVGRNGKVKEKQTRVHANHLAGYVSPAFVAAVKGLRVECSELGHLSGRDTSLLLAFPLEYQCLLDTTVRASRANAHPYQSRLYYDKMIKAYRIQQSKYVDVPGGMGIGYRLENPYIINDPHFPTPDSYSGPISYYLVFFKKQ